MKKVPLYAKYISIVSKNEEQLEKLTDPNIHNTPIYNLWLLNSFKISSKTVENLKAIYPNSIRLKANPKTEDEAINQVLFENFTKLLSMLDQSSLEMDFEQEDYYFKLVFNDAIFKVVESKRECSYIRAKSVEIRCSGEEFCWIK